MDGGVYLVGMGGLMSALLSIIAYFLHYLYQDFRKTQKDLMELKADIRVIQVDLKVFAHRMGWKDTWISAPPPNGN